MRHVQHHHGPPTDPELTPGERELESALGGLRLRPAGSDPVAIAFDAGRETARGQVTRWRLASGAMAAALLLTLASIPMTRTTTPSGSNTSLVSQRSAVAPPELVSQSAPHDFVGDADGDEGSPVTRGALAVYFELRDRVRDQGAHALPAPPPVRSDRPVPTAMTAPDEWARTLGPAHERQSLIPGRS
jgi:hypothetical protein